MIFWRFLIANLFACGFSGTDGSQNVVPDRREMYGNGRIYDISHRYTAEMPWAYSPGDGLGQFLWLEKSMKNGSRSNESLMKMPTHAGTHVDAPGHFFDNYFDAGFDVDSLDLEVLNGPALLVDVPRDKNITADVMKLLNVPKGVLRVLFRTLNTDRNLILKKEFDTSFTGFTKDGAQWLVDNTDIKLVGFILELPTYGECVENIQKTSPVALLSLRRSCPSWIYHAGIDYVSVPAFSDIISGHRVLLQGRDIIIVESLKLEQVPAGVYDVHCLPLRLIGAEGSPARCILIN